MSPTTGVGSSGQVPTSLVNRSSQRLPSTAAKSAELPPPAGKHGQRPPPRATGLGVTGLIPPILELTEDEKSIWRRMVIMSVPNGAAALQKECEDFQVCLNQTTLRDCRSNQDYNAKLHKLAKEIKEIMKGGEETFDNDFHLRYEQRMDDEIHEIAQFIAETAIEHAALSYQAKVAAKRARRNAMDDDLVQEATESNTVNDEKASYGHGFWTSDGYVWYVDGNGEWQRDERFYREELDSDISKSAQNN